MSQRAATITSLAVCTLLGVWIWVSWPAAPVVQLPPYTDYQVKYPVRLEILGDTVRSPVVGTVTRVLDGDTLDVELFPGNVLRVRLAAIDAPEKRQPFGDAATQFLNAAVCTGPVGVYSVETDRYGREIAYVFVDDVCINALLVQQGLAWHYKAYSKSEELAAAEQAAAASELYIWSDEKPIPPWDWRKGVRE